MKSKHYGVIFCICFLILIKTILPLEAQDINEVRVRILHKYHPSSLIVHTDEPGQGAILVDCARTFPVEFSPKESYTLLIPAQSIKRSYFGRIYIYREKDELVIVNILPLEEYVTSVVLSELGWTAKEAMRAQAILARTWALTNQHRDQPYDFDDLTHSQVYKGLFPQTEATRQLLGETYGQILTSHNKPIHIVYHAACSDRVYSAYEIWGIRHEPCLTHVELPDILHASRNDSAWERTLPKPAIDQLFRKQATSDCSHCSDKISYNKIQREGKLGIYVNERWIGIDNFRLIINRALGWNQLRSNDFTMDIKGDTIHFKGKGFGHLVGLCQQEAVTLAENGYNYQRILGIFYPGSTISAINTLSIKTFLSDKE
ncbi:MAG: SpoIID/LytB domain-containing protein [bacterium]